MRKTIALTDVFFEIFFEAGVIFESCDSDSDFDSCECRIRLLKKVLFEYAHVPSDFSKNQFVSDLIDKYFSAIYSFPGCDKILITELFSTELSSIFDGKEVN